MSNGFACFTCDLCSFDLCSKCLEVKEINNPKTSFPDKISEMTPLTTPNHPHTFTKLQVDNIHTICEGKYLFGQCKSGADLNKNHENFGLKCNDCENFYLCEECIKEKTLVATFKTEKHPHMLIKFQKDSGWKCNGNLIHRKCKSGLDKFHKSDGFARYKCLNCINFDLCHKCLFNK